MPVSPFQLCKTSLSLLLSAIVILPVYDWLAPVAIKPSIFCASFPSARTTTAAILVMRLIGLNFGRFVSGDHPDTITFSPQGIHTATGGVLLSGTDPGRPAQIMVSGIKDSRFTVRVNDAGPVLKPLLADTEGVLSSGSVVIPVGGTLYVPAHSKRDLVTVPFSVSVAYI